MAGIIGALDWVTDLGSIVTALLVILFLNLTFQLMRGPGTGLDNFWGSSQL